jgi:hypothetical protein
MTGPLHYGTVVVIGGGCYGSWYTQQLARAMRKGALAVDRVVVVDRDPACRVARERGRFAPLPLDVHIATWDAWLADWLGAPAMGASAMGASAMGASAMGASAMGAPDMLVPSPLMPHLLLDWLVARAEARWPDRLVRVDPLHAPPAVPWERAAPDGRHYVSFADWMCPVNCIEPARCPVTRGPRDWSLPPALSAYVATERFAGRSLEGPIIFHCVHRTWGVGMVELDTVRAADALIARSVGSDEARFLVGTVSHCHGALGVLRVSACGGPPSPSLAAHVQDS